MSFQITISPSRRAAARFVTSVRRTIQKAYAEEQKNGLTQTAIAAAIGVHRSVINRELRGRKDITVGRVAELAWAMGRKPFFEMPMIQASLSSNLPPVSIDRLPQSIKSFTATNAPASANAQPIMGVTAS